MSAVKNENLEMVVWLHECCPSVLPYQVLIEAARTGNVRIMQWLLARHASVPWMPHMIDAAASSGQLHMLQWLHEQPKNAGCTAEALDSAVHNGHIDTVKWLYTHYANISMVSDSDIACAMHGGHKKLVELLHSHPEFRKLKLANGMRWFAEQGNLEMVQVLFATADELDYMKIDKPIDDAARNGHLHVVKWLHEHHVGTCSNQAMDNAAENGHLEVVQWLHANRSEGCSTRAMNLAAKEGHLDVVKWLHANRTEGCTTEAMDWAARKGRSAVVKWLCENRSEGCTVYAMEKAVVKGHFDIVLMLHTARGGGLNGSAIDEGDVLFKNVEIAQWLMGKYADGVDIQYISNPYTRATIRRQYGSLTSWTMHYERGGLLDRFSFKQSPRRSFDLQRETFL